MPRILIVEDESIVADDIQTKLEQYGYHVTGLAASGREAIQMAKEDPPDLIVMDIRIKGDLNGVETAIVIQGHFEKPIPVVFLTAFSASEYPVLRAVEPYIYINKPFSTQELVQAVERALKSHNR